MASDRSEGESRRAGSRGGEELESAATPGSAAARGGSGYVAFVGGGVLGVVAFVGLLASTVPATGTGAFWLLRSVAVAAGGLGLATMLYGTVALVPRGAGVARAALVGLVVSATGVALFLLWYPGNWGSQPDYSRVAITVYAAGLAIQAGTVALSPVVHQEPDREDDGQESDPEQDPAEAATFELYERDGWHWRLVAHEGGTLATSTRSHDSEAEVREAVESLAGAAPGAGTAVRDAPPTTVVPLPDEEATEEPPEEDDDAVEEQPLEDPGEVGGRSGESNVELFETGDGWHWRLRHPSGTVLAESGAAFDDMEAAETAVDYVRRHAPGAGTLEFSPGGFEVYERRDEDSPDDDAGRPPTAESGSVDLDDPGEPADAGDDEEGVPSSGGGLEWRWRLRHHSGEVVARPPGPFGSLEAAMVGIERVKAAVDSQPAIREEAGSWRWRLGHEGEAVATAVENHPTEIRATGAFERVRSCARTGGAIELDPVGFQVVLSGEEWGWRLRHRDGSVLARRDGYASRQRAVDGIWAVMESVTGADVTMRSGDTARVIDEAIAQAARARSTAEQLPTDEDPIDDGSDPGSEDPDPGTEDQDPGDSGSDADGDSETDADTRSETDADTDPHPDAGADEAAHVEAGTSSSHAESGGVESEPADPAVETEDGSSDDGDGDPKATVPGAGRTEDRSERTDQAESTTAERRTPGGRTLRSAGETLYEVYESERGEWAWQFRRGTYVVATAGGFDHRAAAIDGIERVRETIATAPRVRVDPGAFEIYRSEGPRWRFVAPDGAVLATGDGDYDDPDEARTAIETALDGLDGGVQLYEDDGWRWRLRHEGAILAAGPGGYDSTDAAKAAVDRVREAAPDAPVAECDPAVVEVYPAGDEWGWRLRDADGELLAGADGYGGPGDVERALADVQKTAPEAPMRIVEEPHGN